MTDATKIVIAIVLVAVVAGGIYLATRPPPRRAGTSPRTDELDEQGPDASTVVGGVLGVVRAGIEGGVRVREGDQETERARIAAETERLNRQRAST